MDEADSNTTSKAALVEFIATISRRKPGLAGLTSQSAIDEFEFQCLNRNMGSSFNAYLACLGIVLSASLAKAQLFQLLGKPAGGFSTADAISGDGSVVAGSVTGDFFRWTAASGMVRLGRPP